MLSYDCQKIHDAGNDFTATSTPREAYRMQSLKGHKITLIAVLDLLGWDNVEVRSSLADSLLALG